MMVCPRFHINFQMLLEFNSPFDIAGGVGLANGEFAVRKADERHVVASLDMLPTIEYRSCRLDPTASTRRVRGIAEASAKTPRRHFFLLARFHTEFSTVREFTVRSQFLPGNNE